MLLTTAIQASRNQRRPDRESRASPTCPRPPEPLQDPLPKRCDIENNPHQRTLKNKQQFQNQLFKTIS